MIKNLGKFKQWTNEKFGGARVTLQTEDFQRLVQETEHRRGGYDKIVESVEILLSYILKRKTSPEDSRKKMLPLESFGSCLYHYGTVFPEDSGLGVALLNVGQIETRIAILQEVLADEIKTHYMTMLQNGIKEYKEYDTLKKKLASRRLDYDSKLSKLKKAKKEKPDLEQEIQAARIKYEDTEHDLIQKMAILQEFEDEHKNALLQVVDAQLAYHEQAHDLLLGLKSTWGEGRRDSGGSLLGRLVPRNEDNNNTTTTLKPNNISNTSISKSSCSSNSSNNAAEVASNNTSGSNSSASNRTKSFIKVDHDHYRKAIYDFNGENEDEISFKAGDVITVINQIDKGWWVGEIHNKQGIFPVNFTEEYKSTG